MFTLNIQCSKDITKLNIDFADGTSTIIGDKNEELPQELSTLDTLNVEDDGSKQDVRSPNDAVKRQNLQTYGDQLIPVDVDENLHVDVLKPPEIEKRDRVINVADEAKDFNL